MSANALSITMPMRIQAPKGRILCVDDEPNILRALSWLLKKDFQVVTAQSARDGLELVRTGDFDVVISDQRMPEMSGIDFLNQVKMMAPRAMRILLTGYSDMQAVLRSVNEAEIFRYVSKPWDVTELPGIVAQAAEIARRQESELANPPPIIDAQAHRPTKLLVLDDDESIHSTVEMSVGDLAEVIHVTSPVDALSILAKEDIGVIIAERTLGTMDLTHLLCLLKRQHPQIVSIVLTESMDSSLITKLINQGQIYRFIPKPVKAGFLRLTLKSALVRHKELLDNPALSERYQGATGSPGDILNFQTLAAAGAPSAEDPTMAGARSAIPNRSLFGQLGGLLRRVFGA
jgi:serine/threonine-protein kinase